jgi:hypothetical protein
VENTSVYAARLEGAGIEARHFGIIFEFRGSEGYVSSFEGFWKVVEKGCSYRRQN